MPFQLGSESAGATKHTGDHYYFSTSAFLETYVYVSLHGETWIGPDKKIRFQFEDVKISKDNIKYDLSVVDAKGKETPMR